MVRWIVILLCLLSLSGGCRMNDQRKPARVHSILECLSSEKSARNFAAVSECVPLSRPLRLKGTWFVGFEESAFRRGYLRAPATSDIHDVPLIFSDAAAKFAPPIKDGQASAYQLDFVGRFALVDRADLQVVVVDRVISIREVPRSETRSQGLGKPSSVH